MQDGGLAHHAADDRRWLGVDQYTGEVFVTVDGRHYPLTVQDCAADWRVG